MSATGVNALFPEIWEIVLAYLHKPVPPPLSRPPRSELRQPHLTSAARTCRLFHSICTPILYRTVVTDDLPSLLYDPHCPKRRLSLAFTQHLLVEYGHEMEDVTYHELMRDGQIFWVEVGPLNGLAVDNPAAALDATSLESSRLTCALHRLSADDPRLVFPRIATVAVSSIYGRQTHVWRQVQAMRIEAVGEAKYQYTCKYWWDIFLARCRVSHWCCRDMCGPLAPIPRSPYVSGVHQPEQTIHFTNEDDGLSIRPGVRARWLLDERTDLDWQEYFNLVLSHVSHMIHYQCEEAKKYPSPNRPVLSIDIYCSTNRVGWQPTPKADEPLTLREIAREANLTIDTDGYLGPASRRAMAAAAGAYIQDAIRMNTGAKDVVRWRTSEEAPICVACGSKPPAS